MLNIGDFARYGRVSVRMLRLRRAELEARMNADAVSIKHIPPVRVAELPGEAAGFAPEHIGPVIQPLYPELARLLTEADVAVTGPGIAYYEDSPDGTITVHACLPIAAEPDEAYGFAVVDLPAIEAATIVHRGSMDTVVATDQLLARWVEAAGRRADGYPRELYVHCPPGALDEWVTELQTPVANA